MQTKLNGESRINAEDMMSIQTSLINTVKVDSMIEEFELV
jgi:hypothetical protein